MRKIHEFLVFLFKPNKQGERIMAAIDNLTQAVNGLTAKVGEVQVAITALKAVPNNDEAIQAAADAIVKATSDLGDSIS